MKQITLKNISKSFGSTRVLRNVSLEIEKGEFVVLLGPSGCGKSTLLRVIAGLEKAEEGTISIESRDITHLESAQRDLAMVFQSYALYPHMTVKKNISYPLVIRKTPDHEINREVESVARRLGLSDLLDRRPKELSGGQRQRVALARAIVRRPQAFLMDEPLSNLDAGLRVQMRSELKHLHSELKATMIYVTHDQTEAMTLAQRIAVMKDGVVQQFDTPRRIYSSPANSFVAQFVGSPSMNLVTGDFKGSSIENEHVKINLGQKLSAALAELRLDRITLGFRPEDLNLSKTEKPGSTLARVFVTEELGNENLVIMNGAGPQRIVARTPSDLSFPYDSQIWFGLDEDKIQLFDPVSGMSVAPLLPNT